MLSFLLPVSSRSGAPTFSSAGLAGWNAHSTRGSACGRVNHAHFKILLRNFGYVIDGNYRWKITQSWDRVCLPVVGGHDLPFMTSLPPS